MSLSESIKRLNDEERDIALNSLTLEELEVIKYDWEGFWARTSQIEPDGNWRNWLILSGRGWGKTRCGAEWVVKFAKNNPKRHLAVVGQTKGDVRDTMVEVGESSILKISPPWFYPSYEPSKRRLVWPNGCVAGLYSGDSPDQLRGPNFSAAWCDELAKFQYAEDTWSNLQMALRVGKSPRVVITTTPRPTKIIKQIIQSPDTHVTYGTTYENQENLSAAFIESITSQYEGTRLGEQELMGKLLSDNPLALFPQNVIERTRFNSFNQLPAMTRICVAVDPAGTSEKTSSETGIIVAGKGEDGNAYIWGDLSGRARPLEWARRAVRAYREVDADALVVETNHGGEMVIENLRSVDPNVRIVPVKASKGKEARAEPVASLFERGKVRIVGHLDKLEDQMVSFVPGLRARDQASGTDRMDAMCWAIHYLLVANRSFAIY